MNKQEPMAWKDKTYGNLHHQDFGNSIPLYTRPQAREWVGLTEEERTEIRSKVQVYTAMDNIQYGLAIQHATETKLREKNNG